MQTTRPTPLFAQAGPDHWAERWGSFISSSAIFAALLVVAATMELADKPPEPDPPRIAMILSRPEPLEPEPPPPPPPMPDSTFEEAVALTTNPADIEEFRPDAADLVTAATDLVPNPLDPSADPGQGTRYDPRAIAALEQKMLDFRDQVEANQSQLEADIMRLAVESAGKEFILNSDGGKAGIIRTFDAVGIPEDVLLPVLRRYGITMEMRHTRPSGGRAFLSAARTEMGDFTTVQQEGEYMVFVLSAKAVSMMASMETAALMERGFEPRKTRVRRVEFGIVRDEDGRWALGVTDLQVEQVR